MLIKLTVSEALAVSVADAKARLRIEPDFEDDDADLERMIRAATAMVEGATGRVLLPTDFEFRCDSWGLYDIAIPAMPLREVAEVLYLDQAHIERVVDPAFWYTAETSQGFRLFIDSGYAMPALSSRENPVRVRFSAGYDDPEDISGRADLLPDPRDALLILLLVGTWYANRETVTDLSLAEVPHGFGALVEQRRIYR